MRLSQALARAVMGISRREAETWIRAGRVKVNGKLQDEPGAPFDPDTDRLEVDGRWVVPGPRVVICLNKPVGYVTTRKDPHAKHTVYELLPRSLAGLHPVGRLDADSRGLLLLTQDGDLTAGLLHPRTHVSRTYRVRVRGRLDAEALAELRNGVDLADGKTAPIRVRTISYGDFKTELELTLQEGRYRQIRRMLASLGFPVLDLCRVRFGPVRLGKLSEGAWRHATRSEMEALMFAVTRKGEHLGNAATTRIAPTNSRLVPGNRSLSQCHP